MAKDWHNGHTISDHIDPAHPDWARPLQVRHEMLNGFNYRSHLGPDTNLDQVKFTEWTAVCGCKITYIWHRDSDAEDRVHIPIKVHNICEDHEQHKDNIDSHYKALVKG